jgi:hypothetical protein
LTFVCPPNNDQVIQRDFMDVNPDSIGFNMMALAKVPEDE